MKLINKIFGFSTQDLYLVELLRYDRVLRSEFYDSWSHYWYKFEPRKYIIARKKDTLRVDFEDVFTGFTYPNYKTNTLECDNGKTVAKIVSPFVSNKRRIKSKNTVLIKK
jgi:hypothetical protein